MQAWSIEDSDLLHAQKTLNTINKVENFVEKLEDVKDFMQFSVQPDEISKLAKEELSKNILSFIDDLSNNVDSIAASKEIKDFLDFSLKFRQYSFTNTLLIYMQKGNATHVAKATLWTTMHRRVKENATKIFIYVPIKKVRFGYDKTKDMDAKNKDSKGLIGKNKNAGKYIVTNFMLKPIYDISDTEPIDAEGEIPVTPEWSDKNTPNETADIVVEAAMELMNTMGIKIGNENAKGGEMGWSSGGHINLSSSISGVNKASTFIHEIAHELMHFDKKSLFYDKKTNDRSRPTVELQAESVSYSVLRHYKLPVDHQPKYLALWKANKDSIKSNFEIIKNVSNFIIDELDSIIKKNNKKTKH